MRNAVFVHVPKTAGTSFHNALRTALGAGAVSPSFIATRLTLADAQRLDRFKIISGHISMADVRRFFPDRIILTILREPIDRCLSWYYFARQPSTRAFAPDFVAAKQHEIDSFFNLNDREIYRNVVNRQVRQLGDHVLNAESNLDRALDIATDVITSAAWVGRQEQLDADLAKLGVRIPELAGLTLPTLNVSDDRKAAHELDPELVARIRSLNEYDEELYARACRDN
jgi:hypothetical protein